MQWLLVARHCASPVALGYPELHCPPLPWCFCRSRVQQGVRKGEVPHQAEVICFLASSDADFVTSVTIKVTGGN